MRKHRKYVAQIVISKIDAWSNQYLFRDIAKRNYELEQVKFTLEGKKVRDHPL